MSAKDIELVRDTLQRCEQGDTPDRMGEEAIEAFNRLHPQPYTPGYWSPNPARDGMTVGDVLNILHGYPRELRLRFKSSESGGYWPHMGGPSEGSRVAMSVFIGEQFGHVDGSRVGGENYMLISLMRLNRE